MVLAIDFDDTLCDSSNVQTGYRMGQPIKGAVLATQRLAEQGHTIVIFTARNVNNPSAYKAVDDWLNYFQIPHHGITNVKRPEFELYIDNRALHFGGDWSQTLGDITKFEQNGHPLNQPNETKLIDDITKPL